MTRASLTALAAMALAAVGVAGFYAIQPAHAAPPVTAGTEDHERGNLCHPNLGKAPTCLTKCALDGSTTVKVRAGRYLLHVNTSLARVSTGATTAATDAPFVAGSQLPVTVPGTALKDYSCWSERVPLANVCFIPCQ